MRRRRRDTLILLVSSTVLGLAIGSLCAWAAGPTLGAFVAPLALLAPVIPQLAGRHRNLAAGAGATGILCLAIVAAWCTTGGVDAADLLRATLVLAGWTFLLWAVTAVLIRRPRPRRGILRAAAVTIAAWLWLGFPIWLGPTLAEHGRDVPVWLSTVHPLLAMNTAVIDLGIWTQQPIVYQLTPLGQDVAYALPRTIWPFVLLHVLVIAVIVVIRAVGGPASSRAVGGVDVER